MSLAPARETARRGPRPDYVRDETGREIFGLRMMTTSRKDAEGRPIVRYYSDTPEGKRVYHGDSRDKAVAVFAFRQWESAQTGEAIRVTVNGEPSPDVKRAWEYFAESDPPERARWYRENPLPAKVRKSADAPADSFFRKVREMLLSDPSLLAQKTGIPLLTRLETLPKPTPPISLVAVGDVYEQRKGGEISVKEIGKVKTWWAEFCRYVAPITTVQQLDFHAFDGYAAKVKAEAAKVSPHTGRKRSRANYIRNRFLTIRTILNHAHRCRKIDPAEIARLKMEWAEPLKAPKRPRGNAEEITPDEFRAMLAAAKTTQDRCLLLLMLGAALYPVDASRLTWDCLDLEAGTLVFVREKCDKGESAGVVRVAVLWKRTVAELKRYKAELSKTEPADPVFPSVQKRPMHPDTVYDHVIALRDAAGIKARKDKNGNEWNIAAEHLRDSAMTIAARNAPQAQYQVLGGHIAGTVADDSYIAKNPFFVADACGAIERHYFGNASQPAESLRNGEPSKPKPKEPKGA